MPSNRKSCALCDKPIDPAFRPFCSRGCRDRDLNAWFDEGYRIAAPLDVEDGETPDPEAD